MSDQHAETLKYEATEIERLEAELAAANAKIAGFESLTRRPWLAPARVRRRARERRKWYTEFLLNSESVTPKPTDNGESAT